MASIFGTINCLLVFVTTYNHDRRILQYEFYVVDYYLHKRRETKGMQNPTEFMIEYFPNLRLRSCDGNIEGRRERAPVLPDKGRFI